MPRHSVVSLPCPHCGLKLRAPVSGEGRQFTCHHCRRPVMVPAPPGNRAETVRDPYTVIHWSPQRRPA